VAVAIAKLNSLAGCCCCCCGRQRSNDPQIADEEEEEEEEEEGVALNPRMNHYDMYPLSAFTLGLGH
jgi:hypothetical protein